MADYYALLGVSKSATADEIKKAYRQMARTYHPDVNKAPDAEKKLKEINQAYEVLSDPQKRQTYDQVGSAAFEGNAAGGDGGYGDPFAGFGGFGGNGRTYSYTWSNSGGAQSGFENFDPFDILNSVFGGGYAGGRSRQRRPVYEIDLEFEEAVKGVQKEVKLESGSSKSIKIPAGVDDGTTIRFDEFNLVCRVRPSKIFTRDGYDLVVEHDVPLTKAILGGEVEVPTIDGSIKLRIQPGLQPGATVRLRGYGVKSPRGGGQGDQYVKYRVRIPEKLSGKAKRLVEELGKELGD